MTDLMTLAEANSARAALVKALREEIDPDARVGYDKDQFAEDYANWLIDHMWVTREPF